MRAHAADGGHLPVVEALLAAGADVQAANNDGDTALMYAAEGGHLPVVAALLAAGADVQAASNDGGTAARRRLTCRWWRRCWRRAPTCRPPTTTAARRSWLRLRAGTCRWWRRCWRRAPTCRPPPTTTATRRSCLRLAGGHLPVVEALLAAGADVQAADNKADTALMAAALGGHLPVVEALLALFVAYTLGRIVACSALVPLSLADVGALADNGRDPRARHWARLLLWAARALVAVVRARHLACAACGADGVAGADVLPRVRPQMPARDRVETLHKGGTEPR